MFNSNKSKISGALRIANLHSKVFPQFKNIYYGRKIAIVGSGPSLNKYVPLGDAVHIGVNNTFKSHVKFDFLFMIDYLRVKGFIEEANLYMSKECVKFYGIYDKDFNYNLYQCKLHIPEAHAYRANAFRYYCNRVDLFPNEQFTCDLENEPLPIFGSIGFNAISFALYTHPAALYLVGFDMNNEGYFCGAKQEAIMSSIEGYIANWQDGYLKLKEYASIHYPETEIISVNPVGLKGLFKDMYINNGEYIYEDCDTNENKWLKRPAPVNPSDARIERLITT
jgi:hypothetical protein